MKRMVFLICLPLIFLTGCWDQTMLKKLNIVTVAGFDLTKNMKFSATVVIPIIKKGQGSQGGAIGLSAPLDQIITTTASTPRKARIQINNEIFESFNASKLLSLGFGEKLAKTHIFPYLDIFFRDPKGSLNASLFVTNGKSSNILKYSNHLNPKVGNYLDELLLASVRSTSIPKSNIQSISAELLDTGADFVLPFVELKKKQKVIALKGLAMFHGDTFTGHYLTPEESTLFLLLKGEKGKTARQTLKITKNQHPDIVNYVNVDVRKTSPKLRLKIEPTGEVTANIDVKLSIQVEEYPHDKLDTEKERKLLIKRIDTSFAKRANTILTTLQKNNCDALGIGRRLKAFHHNYWLKTDWEHDYSKVHFNVKVKTILLQQGATN